MQTFLPYADFEASARSLDDKRLGKQRVECLQILKALSDPNYGWQHHPAVKMWRGYELALVMYGIIICRVWTERGFLDGVDEQIRDLAYEQGWVDSVIPHPHWFGDPDFHLSHQSNLLRKYPEHYGQIFLDSVPHDMDYIWPTD